MFRIHSAGPLAISVLLASFAGTADASSFQLLLETRQDSTAPFETYLASFATLDDVFNGTIGSPTDFTQLEIAPDYQVAGLTYDGSYHLLLETRQDSTAPFETYLATFATLDDVFNATIGSPTDFTQLEIAPDYRIAGFSTDYLPVVAPPASVPEPGTLALLGLGIFGMSVSRRRRA
jgi:hypothetical protein